MNLSLLIFLGGILHFGTLLASVTAPRVLNWKRSLAQLDPLSRQVIWVHGAFLVLVIIGFGVLSILYSGQLAAGSPLARSVCAFIALFWLARLGIQLFVFDAKPYLNKALLKLGYNGLTLVFVYQAVIYGAAAWH